MVNPSIIFKIKGLWNQFTSQHPKFPLFLKAVSDKGLEEDAVIEIKITTIDGEHYQTNLKLTKSDLELFDAIKQMSA